LNFEGEERDFEVVERREDEDEFFCVVLSQLL
jgi:hypothetical protein